MTQKKVFIDAHKLMEYTDYGRNIYEMIFPDLESVDSTHFKKIMNPFYADTNPSLSIFKGKTWWQHNDFGDETFSGNALDIAALHYDLDRETQFSDLLLRIATDLKIDLKLVEREFDPRVKKDGYALNGEWREDEEGLKAAHSYFESYGITEAVLKRFGVRAVKHLWTMDKTGELKRQYFPKDKVVIAYEDVNHTKLYTPGAEKGFKFRYLGRKPKDFVFGRGEILTDMRLTKNYDRGPLIITGGEKDVMTLVSLGYDAISLNSETGKAPVSLTNGLFHAYDKVVVLYDIDDTGRRQGRKLAQAHGLSLCTLPDELSEKGGKDVSDYIRLNMSIDQLRELIVSSSIPTSILDVSEQEAIGNESERGDETLIDDLTDTPFLPDEVYSLLPQILTHLCDQFDDRRERDVNLLSCLTVMSSCFPTIKGAYGDLPLGCNINLFITAPASAGKGIMSWSRILGKAINIMLKERFEKAYEQYKRDLDSYHRSESGEMEKPKEPVQERLFIPANSSCSSIYEYLDANQHFGVIFDNEGDTLSSTMKNDWADFSSVIRKAFHHEHTSMARRKDREHREVEAPHLSLLLSGTRNQVTKLIDSVENGLFSRFLFYDFDSKVEWRDMFSDGEHRTKNAFETTGEQLLKYWMKGEETGETIFTLTEEQRTMVTEYFTKKLQEMYSVYGEDIVANVKRICIIYYRIAMVLTTIHNYEEMNLYINKMSERMTLNDGQSRCAFLIVDTLLTHLEFVFTRIQRTGVVSKLNFKQRSLYDSLPKSFSWQEFIAVAGEIGIGGDTVQKYRRDFIKLKLIVSPDHGKYKKI